MDNSKPTTRQRSRTSSQVVRINGARVRLTTRNGKVTTKPALPLEWELQAEMVKVLRNMPEYVDEADMVRPGTFTLAGDFNAARRSMREAAKAKATGLTPGEHDMRLYLFPAGTDGGVLALIEVKGSAPVSKEQRKRHALLAALGFTRQAVVRATTCEEAADKAVALVKGWLAQADNDNEKAEKPGLAA